MDMASRVGRLSLHKARPYCSESFIALFAVFFVVCMFASYTLLKNVSAAQTTEALNYVSLVKEYSVNVEGEKLEITFKPSTSIPNAYAFVNGIEVLSMPDIYSATDGTTMIVGQSAPFYIDNSTALENVYRLNVGGQDISPEKDTGMFRSWYDDTLIYMEQLLLLL
ncbi:hypothetical protein FNV43_RR13331 [Rhamnella rubrinervis]|uniref:Uncharacterized protein n=1 Tax=Rhamnella rubrinervis TaxID=2594499 RepID=A0A8K0H0V1_9ROSA|nr:hypothetical protein FNV43_RR13331 [Rhamnella rubrinervis]